MAKVRPGSTYWVVDEDGIRLDRFLVAAGAASGGRRAARPLLERGRVLVNGRRARKGLRLRTGDRVEVLADDAPTLQPIAGPLPLLHVDAHLVAVDKPPGLPSTAGPSPGPHVAGLLLARFPEMAAITDRRAAGLLHRLDTGTSGLLLAARDLDTWRRWRGAFAAKRLVKDYVAIVHGAIRDARTIDLPLARVPGRRARMMPAPSDRTRAWPAVTEVRPLATGPELSLVALRMRTGVTHQLRVHLASIGHPVLGDRRYGPPGTDAPWHHLHALALRVDGTDDALPEVRAGFPEHWRPLCERLGWSTKV